MTVYALILAIFGFNGDVAVTTTPDYFLTSSACHMAGETAKKDLGGQGARDVRYTCVQVHRPQQEFSGK